MTNAEIDKLETDYRKAGNKPGTLESFFYANVPKMISALRDKNTGKPRSKTQQKD